MEPVHPFVYFTSIITLCISMHTETWKTNLILMHYPSV